MLSRRLIGLACLVLSFVRVGSAGAADPDPNDLFARKNLVAWCIVPFDSKKRGPEERAAMLEKLGFSKFAYDYRAEHIPTFEAEFEALKRHHIDLSAWWFPTVLNDEARMTLALFEKHKLTPELWVTGGGAPANSEPEQQQRVKDEAARIRPIAEAAGKIGCRVALYNHGGWFGEPENQIAIIRELRLPNVGIVYNQHHGHDQLGRFPELLQKMKPYLYTLNLNGMVPDGERKGQKILQLGQGELDLKLLDTIRNSGYKGPIGILGHTQDDAEERLHDNLDGLDWLLPQLNGKPAGPKPKPRTPVPVAQAPAAAVPANLPRLVEGRFGKALDGRAGGAFVAGREEFRRFPMTVECWTKLADKGSYNILVAHEQKSSGTHWELFSMAGSGNFTAYIPGFLPDHCQSNAMICDGKWHHVAMLLESERIRLFVDGQLVANQLHQRTEMKSAPGDLALATLVDKQIGNSGLIDEVRISSGLRFITASPTKPFEVDETTLALWHLDEVVEEKRFEDSTRKHPALVDYKAIPPSDIAQRSKIEGHWGEDALGFRWTEEDSRDDRFGQMDTGPFFSGSITGAGGTVFKGIVVRVGEKRSAAICYDTELMRASAGWTGFLRFDAARFGIIVPPRIEGDVTFTTPLLAGWTRGDQFHDFRKESRYGGLPKGEAHYEGLYRHGNRIVLKFTVGESAGTRTEVWESPWLEESNGSTALSRTLRIGPSTTPMSMLVCEGSARARLIGQTQATIKSDPAQNQVLVIPPHAQPMTIKILIGASNIDPAAFEKLVAASSPAENLESLIKAGPSLWGEPLVTVGEVSKSDTALVVESVTIPFENRFRALMFLGGHDFLPDGRAFVCTLHGDVWLVDGIDESLKHVTWRRFATGLFQPLGVKLVRSADAGVLPNESMALYVVGRDQITRLRDTNGDGEADQFENFNNDAYVSLNGHEYVTCLETDRAGNFYYIKGNCDSAIPHDGSLLRVTPDGKQLEVFATGFRNSNGIGIGPNDEITAAPQEGEWTPASAIFAVRQGKFYGGMMSHHQPLPPTDFERPFSWFPRLADNSSGGQVWVPDHQWGPLANQLLLLSYGQCKIRLMLREPLMTDADKPSSSKHPVALRRSPLVTLNGGSTELPLTFASGVHRGRFNTKDGHLYLTGLKGWVTSAVNDGCFQRVRYTEQPLDVLLGMQTYRNGIALTFSRPLDRQKAEEVDNYQVDVWNYHWSSAYGSPDLKPSLPGQVGRDPVEPKSVTLLEDGRTVFIEIPDLKPVDQMGVAYSLLSGDGKPIEQTAYLTLNGIPDEVMSEARLHRSQADAERLELLSRLSPGVLLTSDAFYAPVLRRSLAWSDLHERPERGVSTFNGYLKVPFTGDYRFSTDTNVQAVFEINGQSYSLSEQPVNVRLNKGMISIQVQPMAVHQSSRFRVMWESDRFPRESIPATALFHETPSDEPSLERRTAATGRSLFAEKKCFSCHVDDIHLDALATVIERQRQAPSLDGIGSRLSSQWLAAWLTNPSHVRPNAIMPQLLDPKKPEALGHLVAYLSSLRDSTDSDATGGQSSSNSSDKAKSESINQGMQLFERLGCIACHTFDPVDSNSEWNRVSLNFVDQKFQPRQLEKFLLEPHQHHVGSHMPDFHVTAEEAAQLATYLSQQSKGRLAAPASANTGQPEQGKKLFGELRCDTCHQVSKSNPLAAANVRSAFSGTNAGCLALPADASSLAPHYQLTEDQRRALHAYLKTNADSKAHLDRDTTPRMTRVLSQLRCTACHARDATSPTWPEIVAEEGSGKILDAVPQLTYVGEKLQGPWIEKLLKGEVRHKPRPWTVARMPSFPAYAHLIAESLADEHGVPFAEALPMELDADQVETGRRLTLRDGGLDCRQCHAVGSEKPRGDAATQIALGINFVQTRDRLRPEFALRQLFDPPRYDIGSRMPRFAPDLKTTAVKQIEGGDARKQFEAIKQFLWSLKSEE